MIFTDRLSLRALPVLTGLPVVVSEYLPWGHMLLETDTMRHASGSGRLPRTIVVGSGPNGRGFADPFAERHRRLAIVEARRTVRHGMGVIDHARDLRDLLLEKAAA